MDKSVWSLLVVALAAAAVGAQTGTEILQNGDMESLDHWECWAHQCILTDDNHSGQHGIESHGRDSNREGPSQYITVQAGRSYSVSAYIKVYYDGGHGQTTQIMMDLVFNDGNHKYLVAAVQSNVWVNSGWVHLTGGFQVPNAQIKSARIYFQGPDAQINFVVDDATVVEADKGGVNTGNHGDTDPGWGIDQIRKSNINVHVTAGGDYNKDDVQISIVQTKKSFPFGTAVDACKYNDPSPSLQGYRDFIHKHFNWAVTENCLKWPVIEPQRGQINYQPAMDLIHGLRSHGIKIRAHNLVWSVDQFVQDWVKQLWGDDLRRAVKEHIEMDMDKTRGLVEHWDVNNENIHGQWYQTRLNDPSYNLELFRIAHNYDPQVKLFLNDYSVVSWDSSTWDYFHMGQQVKNANVGLSGMGAQCHFGDDQDPNPDSLRKNLDILAQVGVPIWITELDVQHSDENVRADYYEKALSTFYGHPAVEGILFWGFWDKAHWRGEPAALVKGDNYEITAAGWRVIDLFENRWMTDVTKILTEVGDQFTVRGFHGDYMVKVMYQGQELNHLRQNFTLVKNSDYSLNINIA